MLRFVLHIFVRLISKEISSVCVILSHFNVRDYIEFTLAIHYEKIGVKNNINNLLIPVKKSSSLHSSPANHRMSLITS